MKDKFLRTFAQIARPGADKLLIWLEDETDFFTAPASTKYHGSFPGGLLDHSLNVYARMVEIAERDLLPHGLPGALDQEDVETMTILALLHDVCKVNTYTLEPGRRKVEGTRNQWEDCEIYAAHDLLPLGHGEKSLYLIQKHMDLHDDEAMAIRWHMGAYDYAARGGSYILTNAMKATPWTWRLQEADMCATWIDEREG